MMDRETWEKAMILAAIIGIDIGNYFCWWDIQLGLSARIKQAECVSKIVPMLIPQEMNDRIREKLRWIENKLKTLFTWILAMGYFWCCW